MAFLREWAAARVEVGRLAVTDKFAWGPDTVLSQCLLCKHTSGHVAICAAFPGSIPDEIMMNQVDHRRPYPGDEGVALAGSIVFEPRGGVNPITLQALYTYLDAL